MKRQKLRKILRKSQSNLKHCVKKIEARAKKWFFYLKKKKTNVYSKYCSEIIIDAKGNI